MDQQQQEQPQADAKVKPIGHWNPERDLPRGLELVRVEVNNRSTLNLQVPHGWLIQPGVSQFEIYLDELPIVQALVEPEPLALEQAARSYRLALANEARDRIDGFSGDAAELLRRVDAKEHLELEAYRYVEARTALSPQGMFRTAMLRDPLPLTSVRVVDRNVPEPQRESVKLLQAEQSRYTKNLGESIAVGIAEAMKPMLAAQAEQTKLISSLVQALQKK